MTVAMSPESRRDETAVLSTLALLDRASGGDEGARHALYDRYLPRLRRWARERTDIKSRIEKVLSDIEVLEGFEERKEVAFD